MIRLNLKLPAEPGVPSLFQISMNLSSCRRTRGTRGNEHSLFDQDVNAAWLPSIFLLIQFDEIGLTF